jgi:PAS domain S-box-containing protein
MPADKAKRPGKTPPARKKSVEAFRVLFDHSPDPIYIHDLEGRILEANRTASEIMGYSPEEFRKMRVTDVDGTQATAKVPARIKKVLDKGSYIFESEHKTRSGAVFPVEVNARPIDYMGKKAVIATVRDITKRKADDERQAKLAAITENTSDAIIGLDLDNKVTAWNKGAERIFGYTEAEIIGRPITTLAPDPMKAQGPALLAKIRGGAHLEHFETKRMRKDGTIIDVALTLSPLKDHDGRVIGVSGAVHDITEQKKAEAALRKSEETLRKIIDQSPMSMAIVAMDGTIEHINKKSITTFGYLPEDIPTMDRWWVQAYPEENYRREVTARWMGHIERAISEKHEIEGGEYTVTCKDGSLKIMFIFGVVVAGKVFVMFEDITARKQAEELLQESESKFRTLTENSLVGVYLIQDGRFKYSNPGLAIMFGYTAEEMIDTKTVQDVILPEDWPLVRGNLKKRLAGEIRSINYHFRGVKKNGKVIFAEVYGTLTDYQGKPAIIGTVIDRTEHNKTERLLQESENKFRTLTENSMVGVYLIQDGLIKYTNPWMAEAIGYTPGELIGKKLQDVIFPEDWPIVCENLRKRLTGETKSLNYEFRGVKKNGETIFAEAYGTTTTYLDKPAVIGTLIDRTERKKAEEAIRELNLKLEQRVQERTRELQREVEEHKKTEAALRASETKYRILFDNINDTILVHDAQGNFFDINRGGLERLGYSKDEVLKMNLAQIDAPEAAKRIPVHMAPLLKTGHGVFESVQKSKDGRAIPVEVSAMTFELEGKPTILSVSRDLTARKKAEKELHESRALIESVVERPAVRHIQPCRRGTSGTGPQGHARQK